MRRQIHALSVPTLVLSPLRMVVNAANMIPVMLEKTSQSMYRTPSIPKREKCNRS